MKKLLVTILLLTFVSTTFSGCFGSLNVDDSTTKTLKISGSTSMDRVSTALVEGFSEKNEHIKTDLQAGGSSTGISNMLDGISDIGNASRELKQSEIDKGAVANVIALDAIILIVNKDVNITNLTKQQVKDIYTGKITNWNEVGGYDHEIVVVGRESSSGTRTAFENIIGIDEKIVGQELTETGTVKSSVAGTNGAIGYISLEAIDDTVKTVNFEGVKATIDTVKNNTYKLARNFSMVTKATKSEVTSNFLNYVYSSEGKAIIEKLGLVAVDR